VPPREILARQKESREISTLQRSASKVILPRQQQLKIASLRFVLSGGVRLTPTTVVVKLYPSNAHGDQRTHHEPTSDLRSRRWRCVAHRQQHAYSEHQRKTCGRKPARPFSLGTEQDHDC
jgi:hypothetical protein